MRKLTKTLIALLGVLTLTFGTATALTACSTDKPDDDPGTSTPVTYSVAITPATNGTVKADKQTYNEGDFVTLTITPDAGYELASLTVDGQDKKADVVKGKLQIVINANMTVAATFQEIGPMDAKVAIADGCQMVGMTLTLKTEGKDAQTVTVGNDNTFSLTQVPYGTVYTVTGKIGGIETDLGSFTVKSADTTYDPSATFGMSGAAANYAEGSFTYKYNGVVSGWDFTDLGNNIKDGDAYVATKISISEEAMNKLRDDGEAIFGISMTVGGQTDWVGLWLKGANANGQGNIYGMLANTWSEEGVFLKGGKLTKYGDALVGDGVYLVAQYESATGLFKSWIGTSLEDVVYQRDWGVTSAGGFNFDANAKMTGFGIGKHSTWGNSVEVDVNYSEVRYGATLGEALGLTEDVTISTDSTFEHGTATISGKPYGDVTLTFVPDTNYALASVKINGEDVTVSNNTFVLEGYKLSSVKVEATFEEVLDLASVEVSIPAKVNMNGLTLTLTKGETTTTATVADGKFTLENVKVGDEFAVTATVNGIKTFLGNVSLVRENNSFDPTATLGAGNDGTLDLVNGSYVYKAGGKGGYTFNVSEDVSGDAWVVTKIQMADLDSLIEAKNEAVFGISMKVGDITRVMHIRIYNGTDYHVIVGDWMEGISGNWSEYSAALKGDGLYFAAHYNSENGLLETYIGTSADNMVKLRDWGNDGGQGFKTDSKLVSFGVGYLHDWGPNAPVDIKFSNVRYGATLAEALGTTESAE